MQEKKIVLGIMGKSGTGKTTLINEVYKAIEENKFLMFLDLEAKDVNIVKSFSTREVRKDDDNDLKSHIFVNENKLSKDLKENKIISLYNSPNGYSNWTTEESFDKKVNLYAIDPTAYIDLTNRGIFKTYGIYVTVSDFERTKRLIKRDGTAVFSQEPHLDISILKNNNFKEYIVINGEEPLDVQVKMVITLIKTLCDLNGKSIHS